MWLAIVTFFFVATERFVLVVFFNFVSDHDTCTNSGPEQGDVSNIVLSKLSPQL